MRSLIFRYYKKPDNYYFHFPIKLYKIKNTNLVLIYFESGEKKSEMLNPASLINSTNVF